MKQICCLVDYMDWTFTSSTHYPDFNELALILHHATGMEDFADLPVEEFAKRMEKLKANNFIIDRQMEEGRICWSPTIKRSGSK